MMTNGCSFAELGINRQFLLPTDDATIDVYVKINETQYVNFFDCSNLLTIDDPNRIVFSLGSADDEETDTTTETAKAGPELSF